MQQRIKQLKRVFIPFLFTLIGTVIVYNSFRWFFDLKWGILHLKEDLFFIWLPMIVAALVVIIFLRKRIKTLKVNGKRDQGHFFYQMIFAIIILIPIIISQTYLPKVFYDLKEINHINEIDSLPNEKYFKIDSFHINKNPALIYSTARTFGRNNDRLSYYIYRPSPFLSTHNNYWYGIEYRKSIDNDISDQEKNNEYDSFFRTSNIQYDQINFNDVFYFKKVNYSDNWDGYIRAIKNVYPNIDEDEQTILIPIQTPFEKRIGNQWMNFWLAIGIGSLVAFLMIIIPSTDVDGLNMWKNKVKSDDDTYAFIFSYLNPFGKYPVTAILLNLNFLGFIYFIFSGVNMFSPSSEELLEIGGNRSTEVWEKGEHWRLITAMFIHSGPIHLVLNMFSIGICVSILEKIIHPLKFFIYYILIGIIASICSTFWYPNVVSVGASGALFGLYGILLTMNIFKIFDEDDSNIFIWGILISFGGISLVYGFFNSGIDNAAHLGGLIMGTIFGIIICTLFSDELKEKVRNNSDSDRY